MTSRPILRTRRQAGRRPQQAIDPIRRTLCMAFSDHEAVVEDRGPGDSRSPHPTRSRPATMRPPPECVVSRGGLRCQEDRLRRAASSSRVEMPSLPYTWLMWLPTVRMDTPSCSLIARFDVPRAAISATSCSRRVSAAKRGPAGHRLDERRERGSALPEPGRRSRRRPRVGAPEGHELPPAATHSRPLRLRATASTPQQSSRRPRGARPCRRPQALGCGEPSRRPRGPPRCPRRRRPSASNERAGAPMRAASCNARTAIAASPLAASASAPARARCAPSVRSPAAADAHACPRSISTSMVRITGRWTRSHSAIAAAARCASPVAPQACPRAARHHASTEPGSRRRRTAAAFP